MNWDGGTELQIPVKYYISSFALWAYVLLIVMETLNLVSKFDAFW